MINFIHYILEFLLKHADTIKQWIILIVPELVVAFVIGFIRYLFKKTKWGRRFLNSYSANLLNENVTNEQIKLCNKLLSLLEDSFGSFIISLGLDDYIKYNMIGHFSGKGFFMEEEEFAFVHDFYMDQLERDILPGKNLQQILKNITGFQVALNEDMNVDLLCIDRSEIKDDSIDLFPGKKVELMEICVNFLQTPELYKKCQGIEECLNDTYMPKRLKQRGDEFFDQLLYILNKKTLKITFREESRFFHGKKGEQINYSFDDLYNELIKDQFELELKYNEFKNGIRKILKIDKC